MAIGIITGIIIIILAIACIAFAGYCYEQNNDGVGTISTILTFALIIAFIIVPFSFHTVKTGQVAVVEHLGEAKEIKTAGTHFDLWITNKYKNAGIATI